MQETNTDRVCATVRVLPKVHICDDLCNFDVVPGQHPSYRAMMRHDTLEQIKSKILKTHGDNIAIAQENIEDTNNTLATITLTYTPGYFTQEYPFSEFLVWIEGLWRKGLAEYHHSKRKQIRAKSRC